MKDCVYHGKAFEFYSEFYGEMLKMLGKEVMRMIDILERSRVFETKDAAEQVLIQGDQKKIIRYLR